MTGRCREGEIVTRELLESDESMILQGSSLVLEILNGI
jgi:hypothetical protein